LQVPYGFLSTVSLADFNVLCTCYFIQHCYIYRPSDSTLSEDATGIVADLSVVEPEPEQQKPEFFASAERELDLDPDPT
jgi:hypothetical protein